MNRPFFPLVFLALATLAGPGVRAQTPDWVAGDLIVFTDTDSAPNGAWSWFEDERAIVDDSQPGNTMLLISSVSAAPGRAGDEAGDVDLLWFNIDTNAKGVVELSDRLEQDDHNSAALYVRPDGRYLAMYSKHNTDQTTRYRVSTNPGDPTQWGEEQTHWARGAATYNNVHFLQNDRNGQGRLYNFTRSANFDPVIQTSLNQGSSWFTTGSDGNTNKLLTQGDGGDRPYLKYASDQDEIHFIATEEHPRNFNNSVYHGYVKDGQLFDSQDNLIDDVFNANGVSPTSLTTVFAANDTVDGVNLQRSWTIDLELGEDGQPVGVISARVDGKTNDHRFLYVRFDGTDWQVNSLAKAGGFLYNAEQDYTGLVAIDPNDVNTVYMSSNVDPRDDSSTAKYEIYQGITEDLGESWVWNAITQDSTVDNLRPVVPEWNDESTALVWMRGNYNTYFDWDTEIVGLVLVPEPGSFAAMAVGLAVLGVFRRRSNKGL